MSDQPTVSAAALVQPATGGVSKSAFTVSGTSTAPPAPVRRGRGTFSHRLRTDDLERQQQRLQQQRDNAGEVASSVMTSATTAVVLQPTMLHSKSAASGMVAPEDEAAAPNAQEKKNIPLEPVVYANPTAALAAAAAASRDPHSRDLFGVHQEEQADTTRQLFFRGEKRKRYCMIVGNLQSGRRVVTLKLFGHRGLKPFKLQGKMIRLINLSVGRPRTRKPLLNPDGTQRLDEFGEVMVGDLEEMDEEEEGDGDAVETGRAGDAEAAPGPVTAESARDVAVAVEGGANREESAASPAALLAAGAEQSAEELAARRRAHEAAGFPADDMSIADEGPVPTGQAAAEGGASEEAEKKDAQDAADPRIPATAADPPRSIDDGAAHDPTAAPPATSGAVAAPAPLGLGDSPPPSPSLRAGSKAGNAADAPAGEGHRPQQSSAHPSSSGGHHREPNAVATAATAGKDYVELVGDDEDEDVDHYFEQREDEVVPLTVQRSDEDGGAMGNEVLSLANSPVLTSRYFSSLTDYFLREFRFLLSLDDVRQQNVSVNVNLGAAYCCLARHGSHSTPLKHATFSQFVERMNDESMQLYFIKDCPACVSRAVDRECGALDHESAITMAKIHFFSNERQSRSTARAVWDSERNAFKLLDMENVGVSFNWTIFGLDETLIRQRTEEARKKAVEASPSAEAAAAAAAKAARAKTVAYPFEVEFRAFRRWRQHADHPAAPLAEAILEKLSTAEQGLITHGSSAGYEHLDLSNICELDFAAEDINVESITVEHTARVKPQGTDLLVDNTTSLFIENFAAARHLKEQVAQYGPERVLKLQNASNNNFMRGRGSVGRGRGGRTSGIESISRYDKELMESVLRPAAKLTFFRSRGSTIHWKFRLGSSVEENIAPMAEALRFVQQVLVTANDIERSSDRGGAAPEAL